jgi:hypothetical protein
MSELWRLDNLALCGGRVPEVLGAPRLVDSGPGSALMFDGRQDGLIVPALPLAGAARFTLELVFCPAAGGEREQRVVHLQADGTENRALIETRTAGAEHWFVDTFLRSGAASQTLYAESCLHPFGPWYHVALVYDGAEMRHYVNGGHEMAGAMEFAPLSAGQTSLGMRLNRVSWFRGMIRAVGFTPSALSPAAFLLGSRPAPSSMGGPGE